MSETPTDPADPRFEYQETEAPDSTVLPDAVGDKEFIPYWSCKACGRITLTESDLQRVELGDRVYEYCVACEGINSPLKDRQEIAETPDGMDIVMPALDGGLNEDDWTPPSAA